MIRYSSTAAPPIIFVVIVFGVASAFTANTVDIIAIMLITILFMRTDHENLGTPVIQAGIKYMKHKVKPHKK
jgi:hypothetical protein